MLNGDIFNGNFAEKGQEHDQQGNAQNDEPLYVERIDAQPVQ